MQPSNITEYFMWFACKLRAHLPFPANSQKLETVNKVPEMS